MLQLRGLLVDILFHKYNGQDSSCQPFYEEDAQGEAGALCLESAGDEGVQGDEGEGQERVIWRRAEGGEQAQEVKCSI